jgi:hypothetical protein
MPVGYVSPASPATCTGICKGSTARHAVTRVPLSYELTHVDEAMSARVAEPSVADVSVVLPYDRPGPRSIACREAVESHKS